jgi:predicted PurR-regulated permease PerM
MTQPPPSRPGSTRPSTAPGHEVKPARLWVFLGIWTTIAIAVLIAAQDVLLPFVMSLVVAYVLTPVVARIERAGVPRFVAILLTYAVTLGSIYGSGRAMAPRMVQEVSKLRAEVPGLVTRAKQEWVPWVEAKLLALHLGEPPPPPADDEYDQLPSAVRLVPAPGGAYDVYIARGFEVRPAGDGVLHIDQADAPPRPGAGPSFISRAVGHAVEYGRANTLEILRFGRLVIVGISRGIFVFFLTLMLAGYLMLTRERIYGFFRGLCVPRHRASFDELMVRFDRGLSGVVRGQLLICLVNGVLSAAGFWLFGLKYWPILALLAGVMSILPIFGSILSSVPVVAIGLTQSIGTAVAVLVWIVGIHQLEANFLNPKIIGDAAKIHPVLVVLSLVVGEHLFKLPGALLAVPVLSMLQSLFLHFQRAVYHEDASDSEPPPPPSTHAPSLAAASAGSDPPPPALRSAPPPCGGLPVGADGRVRRSGTVTALPASPGSC